MFILKQKFRNSNVLKRKIILKRRKEHAKTIYSVNIPSKRVANRMNFKLKLGNIGYERKGEHSANMNSLAFPSDI